MDMWNEDGTRVLADPKVPLAKPLIPVLYDSKGQEVVRGQQLYDHQLHKYQIFGRELYYSVDRPEFDVPGDIAPGNYTTKIRAADGKEYNLSYSTVQVLTPEQWVLDKVDVRGVHTGSDPFQIEFLVKGMEQQSSLDTLHFVVKNKAAYNEQGNYLVVARSVPGSAWVKKVTGRDQRVVMTMKPEPGLTLQNAVMYDMEVTSDDPELLCFKQCAGFRVNDTAVSIRDVGFGSSQGPVKVLLSDLTPGKRYTICLRDSSEVTSPVYARWEGKAVAREMEVDLTLKKFGTAMPLEQFGRDMWLEVRSKDDTVSASRQVWNPFCDTGSGTVHASPSLLAAGQTAVTFHMDEPFGALIQSVNDKFTLVNDQGEPVGETTVIRRSWTEELYSGRMECDFNFAAPLAEGEYRLCFNGIPVDTIHVSSGLSAAVVTDSIHGNQLHAPFGSFTAEVAAVNSSGTGTLQFCTPDGTVQLSSTQIQGVQDTNQVWHYDFSLNAQELAPLAGSSDTKLRLLDENGQTTTLEPAALTYTSELGDVLGLDRALYVDWQHVQTGSNTIPALLYQDQLPVNLSLDALEQYVTGNCILAEDQQWGSRINRPVGVQLGELTGKGRTVTITMEQPVQAGRWEVQRSSGECRSRFNTDDSNLAPEIFDNPQRSELGTISGRRLPENGTYTGRLFLDDRCVADHIAITRRSSTALTFDPAVVKESCAGRTANLEVTLDGLVLGSPEIAVTPPQETYLQFDDSAADGVLDQPELDFWVVSADDFREVRVAETQADLTAAAPEPYVSGRCYSYHLRDAAAGGAVPQGDKTIFVELTRSNGEKLVLERSFYYTSVVDYAVEIPAEHSGVLMADEQKGYTLTATASQPYADLAVTLTNEYNMVCVEHMSYVGPVPGVEGRYRYELRLGLSDYDAGRYSKGAYTYNTTNHISVCARQNGENVGVPVERDLSFQRVAGVHDVTISPEGCKEEEYHNYRLIYNKKVCTAVLTAVPEDMEQQSIPADSVTWESEIGTVKDNVLTVTAEPETPAGTYFARVVGVDGTFSQSYTLELVRDEAIAPPDQFRGSIVNGSTNLEWQVMDADVTSATLTWGQGETVTLPCEGAGLMSHTIEGLLKSTDITLVLEDQAGNQTEPMTINTYSAPVIGSLHYNENTRTLDWSCDGDVEQFILTYQANLTGEEQRIVVDDPSVRSLTLQVPPPAGENQITITAVSHQGDKSSYSAAVDYFDPDIRYVDTIRENGKTTLSWETYSYNGHASKWIIAYGPEETSQTNRVEVDGLATSCVIDWDAPGWVTVIPVNMAGQELEGKTTQISDPQPKINKFEVTYDGVNGYVALDVSNVCADMMLSWSEGGSDGDKTQKIPVGTTLCTLKNLKSWNNNVTLHFYNESGTEITSRSTSMQAIPLEELPGLIAVRQDTSGGSGTPQVKVRWDAVNATKFHLKCDNGYVQWTSGSSTSYTLDRDCNEVSVEVYRGNEIFGPFTVSVEPMVIPEPPTNLRAEVDFNRVTLRWDASPSPDVKYRLCSAGYSGDLSDEGVLIPGTEYVIEGADINGVFYVCAVSRQEGYSDELEISARSHRMNADLDEQLRGKVIRAQDAQLMSVTCSAFPENGPSWERMELPQGTRAKLCWAGITDPAVTGELELNVAKIPYSHEGFGSVSEDFCYHFTGSWDHSTLPQGVYQIDLIICLPDGRELQYGSDSRICIAEDQGGSPTIESMTVFDDAGENGVLHTPYASVELAGSDDTGISDLRLSYAPVSSADAESSFTELPMVSFQNQIGQSPVPFSGQAKWSLAYLPNGAYTVKAEVTDLAGHTHTLSRNVTVERTDYPAVTGLKVESSGPRGILLTWDHLPLQYRDESFFGYGVICLDAATKQEIASSLTADDHILIRGDHPGELLLAVLPVDIYTNPGKPATLTVPNTADFQPPVAEKLLTEEIAPGIFKIRIRATDDTALDAASLWVDDAWSPIQLKAPANTKDYTYEAYVNLTGSAVGTPVNVKVQIRDAAGQDSKSIQSSCTPSAAEGEPALGVVDLRQTRGGITTAEVHWTGQNDPSHGGPVAYLIGDSRDLLPGLVRVETDFYTLRSPNQTGTYITVWPVYADGTVGAASEKFNVFFPWEEVTLKIGNHAKLPFTPGQEASVDIRAEKPMSMGVKCVSAELKWKMAGIDGSFENSYVHSQPMSAPVSPLALDMELMGSQKFVSSWCYSGMPRGQYEFWAELTTADGEVLCTEHCTVEITTDKGGKPAEPYLNIRGHRDGGEVCSLNYMETFHGDELDLIGSASDDSGIYQFSFYYLPEKDTGEPVLIGDANDTRKPVLIGDAGLPDNYNGNTYEGELTWDITGMENGIYTITMIATDLGGNTVTCSERIEIQRVNIPAVTGLTVIRNTGSSVTLMWDPLPMEYQPNYQVTCTDTQGNIIAGGQSMGDPGCVIDFTDGCVPAGEIMHFQVVAEIGHSYYTPVSEPLAVVSRFDQEPPEIISVTPDAAQTTIKGVTPITIAVKDNMQLNWVEVRVNGELTAWLNAADQAAAAGTYTFRSVIDPHAVLGAGTELTVEITAVDLSGNHVVKTVSYPLDNQMVPALSGLESSDLTFTSARLNWTHTGDKTPVDYIVWMDTDDNTSNGVSGQWIANTGSPESSYTISSPNGFQGQIKLAAIYADGSTSEPVECSVMTHEMTVAPDSVEIWGSPAPDGTPQYLDLNFTAYSLDDTPFTVQDGATLTIVDKTAGIQYGNPIGILPVSVNGSHLTAQWDYSGKEKGTYFGLLEAKEKDGCLLTATCIIHVEEPTGKAPVIGALEIKDESGLTIEGAISASQVQLIGLITDDHIPYNVRNFARFSWAGKDGVFHPLITHSDDLGSVYPEGSMPEFQFKARANWDLTDLPKGSYTVKLEVRDENGHFTVSQREVMILDHIPPKAVMETDLNQAAVGDTLRFDGAASTDNERIERWEWDFGDGTTGTGMVCEHSYAAAGSYTVTLTVFDPDGNRDTVSKEISVTPKVVSKELTITAVNGYEPNTPAIPNATVTVSGDTFEPVTALTGEDGTARISVPEMDQYTVSVAARGFAPRTLHITGDTVIIASLAPVGVSMVDVELTTTEAKKADLEQAGIDTSDPANQQVHKFATSLCFEAGGSKLDLNLEGFANDKGDIVNQKPDSGTNPDPGAQPEAPTPAGSGWGWNEVPNTDVNVGVFPVAENLVLVVYGQTHWMKEMYGVELLVLNNSYQDPITNCEATLNLPEGLSLAALADGVQNQTIILGEIPAKQSGQTAVNTAKASWYICGDKAGDYFLSASVTGNDPEDFRKEFSAATPVKVYADTALKLTMEADDLLVKGQEYHVRYTLQNVTDKSLCDLSFTLNGAESFHAEYNSDSSITGDSLTQENFPGNKTVTVPELKAGAKLILDFYTDKWFGEKMMLKDLGPTDIGPRLSDVFVTSLEGSTAKVPMEIMVNGINHGTFYEGHKEITGGTSVDIIAPDHQENVILGQGADQVYTFTAAPEGSSGEKLEIKLTGGRFILKNVPMPMAVTPDEVVITVDAEQPDTVSISGDTLTLYGNASLTVTGQGSGSADMVVTTYAKNQPVVNTVSFHGQYFQVKETTGDTAGPTKTFTVTSRKAEDMDAIVVLAAYSDKGQQVDVARQTVKLRKDVEQTVEFTLPDGADYAKLFLLDGNSSPLCEGVRSKSAP